MMGRTRVVEAREEGKVEAAGRLVSEYGAHLEALGFDGARERVGREVAELAEDAGRGAVLVAVDESGGRPVGVVLGVPADEGVWEVRRLYVLPEARGAGVARALVRALVEAARDDGVRRLRLVTLSSFAPAIALYRSLGFRDEPPFRETTVADAVFLARDPAAPEE